MEKIEPKKLKYNMNGLHPFYDEETLQLHYNKHYKGYIKKLNELIEIHDFPEKGLENLIMDIDKYEDDVRFNAGGVYNHEIFWDSMSPKMPKRNNNFKFLINDSFGGAEKLKKELIEAGNSIFGVGWVWLVLNPKDFKLSLEITYNQDNPKMFINPRNKYLLLGLDLWEHSYYLSVHNDKKKYIENFWWIINWQRGNDIINRLLEKK
jgi:Fe-Mn family superoxide dismutase